MAISWLFSLALPLIILVTQGFKAEVNHGTSRRNQDCVQQSHQEEINALVQEFNRTRGWFQLVDALEALVDNSSEVYRQLQRVKYSTSAPLFSFGKRGYTELASLLLCAGLAANISDRHGPGIRGDGRSMLHGAAREGHLELVKLLLDHGADVNVQNMNGYTPLMDAVSTWSSRLDVVQELVYDGANTTLKNNQGRTALDLAMLPEVKQYLRQLPH